MSELVAILKEMLGPGVWWTGPGLVDVSDDEAEKFATERAGNIAQALLSRFGERVTAESPFYPARIYCRICGDAEYGPWGLYPLAGYAKHEPWTGRKSSEKVLMCESCGESTPNRGLYRCTACRKNWVDEEDGVDTCESCLTNV